MDLRFCSNIHALGWLIEKEELGLGGEPARQRYFLLVAAGQISGAGFG